MKICHVAPYFSIRHFGGTTDLMFKLAKSQYNAGLSPVIYSGDYLFDKNLAESLNGIEFRVSKSYFNKQGFHIMPSLNKLFSKEV